MAWLSLYKFRPLIRQIQAAFRRSRPLPTVPATHYVVWSEIDGMGMSCIYATQHMGRSQANVVADIKSTEGASGIRVMRAY